MKKLLFTISLLLGTGSVHAMDPGMAGIARDISCMLFSKYLGQYSSVVFDSIQSACANLRDLKNEAVDIKDDLENIKNNANVPFASGAMRLMQNSYGAAARSVMKTGGAAIRDEALEMTKFFNKELDKTGNMGQLVQKGQDLVDDMVDKVIVKNYAKTGLITLGVVAGSITAYYGSKLAWKYAERELFKPRLIIASSAKTIKERLSALLYTKPQVLPDMIFSEELSQQLNGILETTRTINERVKDGDETMKYRNLLLWGPPGTGKTMFAKGLAIASGMDWAMMSGSSFSKFKKGEGIQALDELFAWAQKSKNGLLIFIDEADSFLAAREDMNPSDERYQLLNNFLNYTGERSNKFMFVFSTNHPDVFDTAMAGRVDDSIEMKLPSEIEAFKVLNLYKNKLLLHAKVSEKFRKSVETILTQEKLKAIAADIKGLSYREIEGIINNIKTTADCSKANAVTEAIVDLTVKAAKLKNQQFAAGFNRKRFPGS